eukprot:Colp12_sorted_trinity150504_noHs@4269
MPGGGGLGSKRPADTKFKQQRLPAWQPIMTPKSVLPAFFIVGIIFVPLGIGLLVSSNQVQEYSVEFTQCQFFNSTSNQLESCALYLDANPGATCKCNVLIQVKEDMVGDVYMYYKLTNFYQNHRRYVKSRDDSQLRGGSGSASSDCSPIQTKTVNGISYNYAPCGLIANSMYNDSIKLLSCAGPTNPDGSCVSTQQRITLNGTN